MKKILVLASAMIFVASVTVFGQTQKPAEKKDQPKTGTTTTTSTTQPATMKQDPAKPAATTTTQTTTKKEEKTATDIAVNELPKAAQDYITKTYPGKKIEKAMKVTESNGMVMYKAEVGGMMLHFDAKGNLTKEGKKEEKATETKTATPSKTQPATTPKKTTETKEPVKK